MRLLLLILSAVFINSCTSQQNIVSMEDYTSIPDNAYVKDVNNTLNFFEGNWINIQDGKKTELEKKRRKPVSIPCT